MDNEKYDRIIESIDSMVRRCTKIRKFDIEWNRKDDTLFDMWFELKRRVTIYHEMNLNQEGTFWSTFDPKGKDEIVFVCHIKPNSVLISAHIHDATEKEIIAVEPSNFPDSPSFDIDLSKTCIFCRYLLY